MQRRIFLLTVGAFAALPARALYDPKPIAVLEAATGTWEGTLTYRDYQKPDRMVTLKAWMTVSLTAPDELALYYLFDDGPGKTVYSYERMKFDLAANQLVWNAGTSKPNRSEYKITSSTIQDGKSALAFEKSDDKRTDRYVLEVTRKNWVLAKHEVSAGAPESLRSRYEFTRREG